MGSTVAGCDRDAVGLLRADIERLLCGVAVVEAVGPHPGSCQRVGAVTINACDRGADRTPGVRWIVHVRRIEIPGRDRHARRSIGDTASLGDRSAGRAADDRRVVGAIDRDGDHLRSAVDGGGGERVGQRLADIERLHGGIAVVERVDPDAGGADGEGAEAIGARGCDADRRPGAQPDCPRRRVEISPVAIGMPGAPLPTPPASVGPAPLAVPVMTAASLAPLMVIVTSLGGAVDREGRERIGERLRSALSACTAALLLSSV